MRAQRLQHTGAAIVGSAAAQANIDSLCPSTDRAKHELAHAIGRSRDRRRFRAGRIPNTRRLGHLNYSRLVLAVHQHPCRHAVAQGPCNLAGQKLAAARGDGIERSLATICQRQSAQLGIGPHLAHAFGNGRLRLCTRNAALKGVDRQQHTAGPAARDTKINRLNGNIFGTRECLGMSDMRLKIGPTTADSTIGVTQPTKIAAQHLTALVCQHAGGHIKPMVQARIGIEVIQRAHRARLGIGRAIHATPHARVNHKPRAHAAGFERHVDRTIGKAPTPKRLSGGAQGQKLGMCRRVLVELTAIMRPRDNLARTHHHSTNRHLAHCRSGARLRQRLAHELLVDFGDRHRSPSLLQIQNDAIITTHGEMAERLNAAVLKTVERESVPGVRIPLSPPP